jgi:DNA replication protein DnaC
MQSGNNEQDKSYECYKCRDKGIYSNGYRNGVEYWKQCECITIRRSKKLMKSSQLSEEFLSKSFDNYRNWAKDERLNQLWKAAKKYSTNFNELRKSEEGHSFGMAGAVGIGKTHLGSAIANHLMRQGIQIVYFNFVNGFKEMFSHYDNGGLEVQKIRESIQRCEVLFLDDIGKGRVNLQTGVPDITKGVYDEMYGLIEYRYFNKLPIIWTSEYELELIDMLGEATASRLMQMTGKNLITAFYSEGETKGKLNYRLRYHFT